MAASVALFPIFRLVAGYAVTARIRTSTPPPVGHVYYDRTDWWNYIATFPRRGSSWCRTSTIARAPARFSAKSTPTSCGRSTVSAYLTNGAVRDLPAVRDTRLQIVAGSTIASHGFTHMVDFGGPVTVAGLPVAPGACCSADCHGVISIPEAIAADIPSAVAEMRARERRIIELCRAPDFSLERLRTVIEGYRGGAKR